MRGALLRRENYSWFVVDFFFSCVCLELLSSTFGKNVRDLNWLVTRFVRELGHGDERILVFKGSLVFRKELLE